MNESFDALSKKFSLTEQAKNEFKAFFENQIVKVFHRQAAEVDKKVPSAVKNVAKTAKAKTGDICTGKKADGEACTFKAKVGTAYCGRHSPDKETAAKSSGIKPRVKKETKHDCNATIVQTGKKCIQPGTTKPEGSEHHYCKRHSEGWVKYEEELQDPQKCSDAEDEPVEEDIEGEA